MISSSQISAQPQYYSNDPVLPGVNSVPAGICDPLLISAIRTGTLKDVTEILEKGGVDVNQSDKDGNFPLDYAVITGQLDVVEALIIAGANVNQVNSGDAFPLLISVDRNKLDILQALITAGADVNQVNESKQGALTTASAKGFLDIVLTLIAAGVGVNQADEDGCTALMLASAKGFLGIVQTLIVAGADINQANNNGVTPFISASANGFLDIVQTLIVARADINQADSDGGTPLIFASSNGILNIVQTLIAAGADINQADSDGGTPLIVASSNGFLDIVRTLIDSKVKINQADKDGNSPLFYAARFNHLSIVNALIDAGANVNQSANLSRNFPLNLVCLLGRLDILNSLLKANADINKVDEITGQSALFTAITGKKLDVVKALLKANADVNLLNKNGSSPLSYAKTFHHKEAESVLIEAGADNRYAMAYVKNKFLAHCWGLSGHSILIREDSTSVSYDVEYLSEKYTLSKVMQFTSSFLDGEADKGTLSDRTILIIKNTLENAWPLKELTPEEIEIRMDQNIPTFFSISPEGHNIGIILTGTQIIFCDRGGSLRKGTTEFYTTTRNKLKESIRIFKDSKAGYRNMYEKVKNDPEFVLDDFFSQKYQGVANCSWASPKASFLALLYVLDANRIFDRKMSLQTARRIYKNFTFKQRIDVLIEYLETTPDDSLLSKDLLVEIYRKLKRKASPGYLAAIDIYMDPRVEDVLINLKTVINRTSGKMVLKEICTPESL